MLPTFITPHSLSLFLDLDSYLLYHTYHRWSSSSSSSISTCLIIMGFEDPHPFNFVEISFKSADGKTLTVSILFLFLLILSVLCFVYFLYSFTRRAMLSRVRTSCPAHSGLDKAEIDRLPVVSYGTNDNNIYGSCKGGGECSICLGCFQDGEKVKVLPLCNHGFHSECVDTWLKNRPSCPLCRASVVLVDPVVHPDEAEVEVVVVPMSTPV